MEGSFHATLIVTGSLLRGGEKVFGWTRIARGKEYQVTAATQAFQRTRGRSGLPVSAVGLGCWAIGGPWEWMNRDLIWRRGGKLHLLAAPV